MVHAATTGTMRGAHRQPDHTSDFETIVAKAADESGASALSALPPSARQRVFDLVLYNHESQLINVRLWELRDMVDQTILVQTAFSFQGGGAKAATAPKVQASMAHRMQRMVFERPPHECSAWLQNQHRDVKPARAKRPSRTKEGAFAWCAQSAARNALTLAFVRAGGTPKDWAVISDADEVPMALAIEKLLYGRDAIRAKARPPQAQAQAHPQKSHIYVLGPARSYRYNLRCQSTVRSPGLWTANAPLLVRGSALLRFGAHRLRDDGSRTCYPVGFLGSCGPIQRTRLENASWHFSSFGGVRSLLAKMQNNSYSFPRELLDERELARRIRDCTPNLLAQNSLAARHTQYWRTGFSELNIPRFPDVPGHVGDELRKGRLWRMMGSAPVNRPVPPESA
eukprot:Transcript_31813.p1 GENE.Transcript_31813~~Transcript_31813.p1  ORF type:complete len:397 (-),score=30.76 Transcript_31813:178-1368(-)